MTLLDVHETGIVTAQEVKDAIREDTCLVTIMFANNEIGTIQPIAEIGKVCREAGVLFHTDAVQAAGHVAIDVNAMNIDMLSMSGHKFHGPKGVGALYARRGIILTNIIEGGAQERGSARARKTSPVLLAWRLRSKMRATIWTKIRKRSRRCATGSLKASARFPIARSTAQDLPVFPAM